MFEVMKLFVMDNPLPKETYSELVKDFEDSADSFLIVKKWVAEMQRCHTYLVEVGRPTMTITKQNTEKGRIMNLDERRSKFEIAMAVDIVRRKEFCILFIYLKPLYKLQTCSTYNYICREIPTICTQTEFLKLKYT